MGRDLPFRLILASGSLGRRELLKLHGYDFESARRGSTNRPKRVSSTAAITSANSRG